MHDDLGVQMLGAASKSSLPHGRVADDAPLASPALARGQHEKKVSFARSPCVCYARSVWLSYALHLTLSKLCPAWLLSFTVGFLSPGV